jgi:Fic family protein
MRYLPQELTNEIRDKYDYLKNQEQYHPEGECRRIALKRIEKEAQIHSYEIENPDSRIPFSISRNNNKKIIRAGIKNIEQAFAWGINNFNPENFDESFIKELGYKIISTNWRYRKDDVKILSARKIPPSRYKVTTREIPWFVDSINKGLENSDILDKLETAIFAHYHISRIHPFDDGNGRVARILQDIILNYYKIPSPVILPGERHTYYTLLQKADFGWEEKTATQNLNLISDGEKLFYEFIAGKINSSLDILVKKCSSKSK